MAEFGRDSRPDSKASRRSERSVRTASSWRPSAAPSAIGSRLASPAASGRISEGELLRRTQSAPTIANGSRASNPLIKPGKPGDNPMAGAISHKSTFIIAKPVSGYEHGSELNESHVLGTLAKGLGAKISATLHHRGEDECGAVIDPNDAHVYVPRAQWTQSHDHPLKANNAQFNEQHYIADELKRLHGKARKVEYMKREVNKQLKERAATRGRAGQEQQNYADLVNADAARFFADQERAKDESNKGYEMLRAGLGQQQSDMSRRAHGARLAEAQDAAENKLRTVQQVCEDMAEAQRKKKQMQKDLQQGLLDNEAKARRLKQEKLEEDEKGKRDMREGLMLDEYRLQATAQRLRAAQDQQNACMDVYDRTAGQVNRDRESAEKLKQDNDEKKHLMRSDAYLGQREKARERQRQHMVIELERMTLAQEHRAMVDKTAKQMERDAVQQATKNSLDAEMAKGQHKRGEEIELQMQLRIQMAEREERDKRDGETRPSGLTTMNMIMSRNGNAVNAMTGLQSRLDASRHCEKPLGREADPGKQGCVPLDASPKTLRRLAKPLGEIPINTVLGGVVGTLGGGGGAVNTALYALGGPLLPKAQATSLLPKSTGIAVRDSKLETHWYEGIPGDQMDAGRKEAKRRGAAKTQANRDLGCPGRNGNPP